MNKAFRNPPLPFTLIELLVVVSMICVLMALLMPALQEARQGAAMVVCANKLRQNSYLLLQYADSHQGFVAVRGFGANNGYEGMYHNSLVVEALDNPNNPEWVGNTFIMGQGNYNADGLLWTQWRCPLYEEDDTNGTYTRRSKAVYGSFLKTPQGPDVQWNDGSGRHARIGYNLRERGLAAGTFPLLMDSSGTTNNGATGCGGNAAIVSGFFGMIGMYHRGKSNVAFADGHVASCGIDKWLESPVQQVRNTISANLRGYFPDGNATISVENKKFNGNSKSF